MKSNALKFLVAVLAGGTLLAATVPAEARDDRRDHREWRHSHPGHGYGDRHQPRHGAKYKSDRKRAVVHQHYYHYPAPRYYAPPRHYRSVNRYAPPPVNRYAPPVYYSRDPAIVISMPPIVIPIR